MDQPRLLQTLDRGIATLKLLAGAAEGLKIAEIAQSLGVDRAIAYRIVSTLEHHGLAHRLSDGRILLGSGVITLAVRAEGNLRGLARPEVEALAARARATAFLSLAEGDEGVAILTAEPRDTFLNIAYRVGTRHPLTRGAAGVAILSGRPEHPDDPDPVRLARRQGFSVTRGELQAGAVGVSAPLHLPRDRFAALEASLGVVALEGLDIDRAAAEVRDAAARLSALLGR